MTKKASRVSVTGIAIDPTLLYRSSNTGTGRMVACTGAAHSNPYIDHCALCAPRWGVVEERAPLLEWAGVVAHCEAGRVVPFSEMSEMAHANVLHENSPYEIVTIRELRRGGNKVTYYGVRKAG